MMKSSLNLTIFYIYFIILITYIRVNFLPIIIIKEMNNGKSRNGHMIEDYLLLLVFTGSLQR